MELLGCSLDDLRVLLVLITQLARLFPSIIVEYLYIGYM